MRTTSRTSRSTTMTTTSSSNGSPFLPGVPRIRTSERRAFKRCPAKWDWAWRKGLVLKHPTPGALWFGIGIHLALQHRYSKPGFDRGRRVLGTWRDYVNGEQASVWIDDGENGVKWADAKELGEIMLGAYLDEYGVDERWFVISAEQTFSRVIERPAHSRRSGPLAVYNGTFDLVARDAEQDDSLWLWDHKTAKSIALDHLSLDDQAGSYWAVATEVLHAQGLIAKDERLDGILYNFLRKAKPDERPRNAAGQACNKPQKKHYLEALSDAGVVVHAKMTIDRLAEEAEKWGVEVLGDVSLNQPPANFHREEVWRTSKEQATQIRKIQNEAVHMDAVRRRLLPIIKNPTQSCKWDCPFFAMCELQEAGDDWREYRDAMYVKRDPYADHRESAEADTDF